MDGADKLMRAMLLLLLLHRQFSDQRLVVRLSHNLLSLWFVGLAMEDMVRDYSAFSKYRDQRFEHDEVTELFKATVGAHQRAPVGRARQRGRHPQPGVGQPQDHAAHAQARVQMSCYGNWCDSIDRPITLIAISLKGCDLILLPALQSEAWAPPMLRLER